MYLQMFYRQKGNRPVTRPQALQDTFDTFADVITAKLSSYFTQADEYHNQCLQGICICILGINLFIYYALFHLLYLIEPKGPEGVNCFRMNQKGLKG